MPLLGLRHAWHAADAFLAHMTERRCVTFLACVSSPLVLITSSSTTKECALPPPNHPSQQSMDVDGVLAACPSLNLPLFMGYLAIPLLDPSCSASGAPALFPSLA
eukprot:scaffold900_cov399-Pavlova_lutheri.AAC.11